MSIQISPLSIANSPFDHIKTPPNLPPDIDIKLPKYIHSNGKYSTSFKWYRAAASQPLYLDLLDAPPEDGPFPKSYERYRFQLNIMPDVSSAVLILISVLDFPMSPGFDTFENTRFCDHMLVSCWIDIGDIKAHTSSFSPTRNVSVILCSYLILLSNSTPTVWYGGLMEQVPTRTEQGKYFNLTWYYADEDPERAFIGCCGE